MWAIRSQALSDGRGLRFEVDLGPSPATFGEILDAWQGDAAFRVRFLEALAGAPLAAFRWETPPVTEATVSRPFEFVLLDSPGLGRRPDPDAFAEHFAGPPGDDVVAFPNLGGDAVMVVPRPVAKSSAYGHLAAFVREAPEGQRQRLWEVVGRVMSERLGPRPVWLNTAGAGVSWLHVRLDSRPKYYGFGPYRGA